MKEEIWVGNIVRPGSNTPKYLCNDSKGSVEFRTMKDHIEIAYLDKKTSTLYFNARCRMQFKAIKRQIIKDYKPKNISEYCTLV